MLDLTYHIDIISLRISPNCHYFMVRHSGDINFTLFTASVFLHHCMRYVVRGCKLPACPRYLPVCLSVSHCVAACLLTRGVLCVLRAQHALCAHEHTRPVVFRLSFHPPHAQLITQRMHPPQCQLLHQPQSPQAHNLLRSGQQRIQRISLVHCHNHTIQITQEAQEPRLSALVRVAQRHALGLCLHLVDHAQLLATWDTQRRLLALPSTPVRWAF